MFCTECGKSNHDGARFCWACGGDLSQSRPPDSDSYLLSIGGAGATRLEEPAGAGGRSIDAAGVTQLEHHLEAPELGALAPGVLIENHYRVERKLGQGGMGQVWLARDVRLDARPTALKFISPALWQSPSARQRFLGEARVCLDLTHTGIVRVHHLGEWAGLDYLAMEYLDGRTLHQWRAELSAKGARPEWAAVSDILGQVLDAVGYAHEAGVIHRDLKPANIMLARGAAGRLRVVVLDFGLARTLAGEGLTRTHAALGTPYYMAPEQMDGIRGIDRRCDIFALGVIAYEMLAGKVPLGRVAPPSTLVPGLPRGIDEFIFKCLEFDPAARFASARAMAAELKKLSLEQMDVALHRAATAKGAPKPAAKETTAKVPPTAKPATPAAKKVTPSPLPPVVVKKDSSASGPPIIFKKPAEPAAEGPYTEDLGGGVRLELLWIHGGAYLMGNKTGTRDEQPLHLVSLKGFWMGKFPVTQAQYERVMGSNPSHFKGADNPADSVTWAAAEGFCQKLSEKTGKRYALPSEAQWEYACRAGGQGRWCFGDDEKLLKDYAWYKENSGLLFKWSPSTWPVGKRKPNAWGLHDMHGNVFEWCADWYHDSYNGVPADGSAWLVPPGNMRVLRGGSWDATAEQCQSGLRSPYQPERLNKSCGLRVVRNG